MNPPLSQCDFSDPASVVFHFISAMNAWELKSWQSQRANRGAVDVAVHQSGILDDMQTIFALYCTPKKRANGRNGSFQRPPEYDPVRERILHFREDEDGKHAFVTTYREGTLGGGHHKYTLVRRTGKWFIDTLKRQTGDEWRNAIL